MDLHISVCFFIAINPTILFADYTNSTTTTTTTNNLYITSPSRGETNYCNLKDGVQHTMCLFKKEALGALCSSDSSILHLSDEEKKNCLNLHNDIRSSLAVGEYAKYGCPAAANLMELEWDDELATIAQRWAEQCPKTHDFNRNVARFQCGQNIYLESTTGKHPSYNEICENAVKNWADEVSKMSKKIVKKCCSKDTSNFTQIVWHKTLYMGCGIQRYSDKQDINLKYTSLVCNYGPKGNRINQPVYKTGKPCSKCPKEYYCSSRYSGLCTDKGSVGESPPKQSNGIMNMKCVKLVILVLAIKIVLL